MEWDRHNFLSFWTIFCPFTRPTDAENQNFEKMKKTPKEIIILQMCTIDDSRMMYVCWDMECNRHTFLLFWIVFLPFYVPNNLKNQNFEKYEKTTYHFTHVYHKWQSCNVWFLRYQERWTEFFLILDCCLHFYPPNLKNQNFEKLKKKPGDIILHMCITNYNHIIYGSWDIKHDGQKFLSFWTAFCPFTP